MSIFEKLFTSDVTVSDGETALGNIGKIGIEIELPIATAALLLMVIVIPILLYFILKKVM